MDILNKLLELKTELNNLKPRKTKAAKEKQWEKARQLRLEMWILIDENREYFDSLVLKHVLKLNVMAPIGGPLYIDPQDTIKIVSNHGSYTTLDIGGHVGIVYFCDNSCGLDNVVILHGLEKELT